ncbi:MAG: hypothetical protein LC793_09795, partial [Thermomicrobia bacterium]|nr:hypothetical protein [Thermomicrobia bacterium]
MPATTIDVLRDPITTAGLARVEDAIRETVAVNYPVMSDLLNGIIAAKGKMLRPRVLLAAARL